MLKQSSSALSKLLKSEAGPFFVTVDLHCQASYRHFGALSSVFAHFSSVADIAYITHEKYKAIWLSMSFCPGCLKRIHIPLFARIILSSRVHIHKTWESVHGIGWKIYDTVRAIQCKTGQLKRRHNISHISAMWYLLPGVFKCQTNGY